MTVDGTMPPPPPTPAVGGADRGETVVDKEHVDDDNDEAEEAEEEEDEHNEEADDDVDEVDKEAAEQDVAVNEALVDSFNELLPAFDEADDDEGLLA